MSVEVTGGAAGVDGVASGDITDGLDGYDVTFSISVGQRTLHRSTFSFGASSAVVDGPIIISYGKGDKDSPVVTGMDGIFEAI